MNTVYLLLGSNLGNRSQRLEEACVLISKSLGEVVKKSQLYSSAPWGFHSAHAFLNQAIKINSTLSPNDLLKTTKQIEKTLGRGTKTTAGYIDRTIDIDILFYNNLIIKETSLTIPHPRLHERKFVLKPLAEITKEFVHPSIGLTVIELLENCTDEIEVNPYDITHE